MRLFFAAWPPAGTAEGLARWARAAQRESGGRAVPAQNIHLTLAFLGDADPAAAALAATARVPALELVLDEARFWAHRRMIWVGSTQAPPALARLAQALGEKRAFAAHVTLIRHVRHGRRLPPFPALPWPVREFTLVDSTLGPQDPSYGVLARYALD